MTTTMIMVIIIESEIETHGMMIATTTMVRHRGGELNIQADESLSLLCRFKLPETETEGTLDLDLATDTMK